ncbi:glycosyltransferase family 4 protein [Vibrio sp. JPW-9-11-11]|uniref:glycosyltransferase family 4 protein n=1 Tax=Vibrio sp. JPW-9-11-11 TaxID=1416532 RepID=UPI0015940B9D|nr:glycosyltransferase family 4 protein [Vibrio sp. JPW-9-11-11]NVD06713.1 glycosyltransferase family 4 protein [Vibrio sp. JPW-9-11-11]
MSSNSSKPVWLLVDSLTFGGIETHLLELAMGLKAFNVPVTVLLLRHYQTSSLLVDKLQQAQIKVEYLDNHRHYLYELIHRIKQNKPAVLHCHGYKASLLGKLVRLITGVRQVTTYHAGETPQGKVWLYDLIDRYSAWFSDRAIVVSNQIAAKIPSETLLLNNFVAVPDDKIVQGTQIAFVGRLSPEKAPDRFMQLARLNPSLEFDVYGAGPMQETLSKQQAHNVRFHGHQANMATVWPKIRVLVICSRYEGLPLTALEAMARGIPVVSLNVGNIPYLIEHQVNGFIGESLEDLNQHLQHYLALPPAEQLALQHIAKSTITTEYSSQSVLPQLLNVYFSHHSQSDYQIEK